MILKHKSGDLYTTRSVTPHNRILSSLMVSVMPKTFTTCFQKMIRSRTSIVAKVHSSTSPTHPKEMLTSVKQSSSINDCICSVIALKSDYNHIEWSWAGLQVAGPACRGSVKCNPAAVPVSPVKTHDRNLSNTL